VKENSCLILFKTMDLCLVFASGFLFDLETVWEGGANRVSKKFNFFC